MDNLQKANIYIINIGAEKIADPNWSIEHKSVYLQAVVDHINNNNFKFFDIPFLNENTTFNIEGVDVDQKGFMEYLEKERNKSIDPQSRTDFYKISEKERDSLYSGSLPVSLDMLNLKKLFPKELYTKDKKNEKKKLFKGDLFSKSDNDKLYTDAIINVTFDKTLYEITDKTESTNDISKITQNKYSGTVKVKTKKLMTAHELRKKFYNEGVTLRFGDSLVEYVKYKRSASKAREGSHLFIKKELKGKISDWEKFDIHYDDKDENVPLVAIKAYESLTSSGIEKTVTIHPNEILLIDDVVKKVKIKASVTTELEDGEIIAKDDDEYKAENIIWDGQSLADTSLFVDNESDEQKGMMLLRNSFFKSCAFNTNIQQWFDYTARDKEYILDMFGRKIKRTDIKLITTPSSLKFLKFYDKFSGANDNEKKKNCYEKWLEKLSREFGVCKHESTSPFGEYHQLSYQIVNSLPLSKEEIKNLLEGELTHIEKTKNDVAYFKSTIKFKDPSPSDALMLMLLEVNDKMWHTKMVKDYVRDKVDSYVANLRKGHIKVKGSDYAVLFGNPLEMLQFALNGKEADIKERPLIGKQVYCSRYENGVKLAGFRNPHITMGNVLVVDNIEVEEFKTFFNLTDNIVISNAYDNDIMYRLQGQDYDSDTVLLCSEPILVKAAEACQNDNFRVPINGIKTESKERKYTLDDEIDIDHKTARNKIGEIINLSQLFNSYYWDWNSKNDGGQYDELLKEYYSQTSILSSLSQIEIDRAKKDYKTDTGKFLKALRDRKYNDELLLKQDKETFKLDKISNDTAKVMAMAQGAIEERSINAGVFLIFSMVGFTDWQHDYLKYSDERYEEIPLDEKKLGQCIERWMEEDVVDGKVEGTHITGGKVPLDDKKIEQLKQFVGDGHIFHTMEVLIRPQFFKYCGVGTQYKFKPFNTPMDYLQQIIDDIKDRKRFETVDIEDIIPKPDFRKADNHQIPKIIETCAKANGYIKAQQSKKNISEAIRYQRTRKKEDEVIQTLSKWTINENTIRIMLYRAFSENKKYHDEKYSKMKRHLASWLYQSQPETFKEVIDMSKGK